MLHDHLCELSQPRALQQCRSCTLYMTSAHCHCGSRAHPLCEGCRDGLHLRHEAAGCDCTLCDESEAA